MTTARVTQHYIEVEYYEVRFTSNTQTETIGITEELTGTIFPTRVYEPNTDGILLSDSIDVLQTPTRVQTNAEETTVFYDNVITNVKPERYYAENNDILNTIDILFIPEMKNNSVYDYFSVDLSFMLGSGKQTSDIVGVVDTTKTTFGKLIYDYLISTSTLLSKWTASFSTYDSFSTSDYSEIRRIYLESILDSLSVTFSFLGGSNIFINDLLKTTDDASSSAKFYRLMAEAILFHSVASTANIYFKNATDTAQLAETAKDGMGKSILEIMRVVETAGCTGSFVRRVEEFITALDAALLAKGYGLTLADTFNASTTLSVSVMMLCLNSDTSAVLEQNSGTIKISPVATGSITISQTLLSKGTLRSTLQDLLSFNLEITINGVTYQCWAFHGDKLFPSLYTNYDFNSFASIGDDNFGCKEDGIYILTGGTDAGTEINSGIKINYGSFGTHLRKRMYHAFFGLVGDTPVLKVVTDNGEGEYYVVGNKAHIAKGLLGVNWELTLAQIDELKFIEVVPLVMSR